MNYQVLIDGKPHDVLGYGRELHGWVGLLVRPEGAVVRGPHAEHSVPTHWWADGFPGSGVTTGGHTYQIPKRVYA